MSDQFSTGSPCGAVRPVVYRSLLAKGKKRWRKELKQLRLRCWYIRPHVRSFGGYWVIVSDGGDTYQPPIGVYTVGRPGYMRQKESIIFVDVQYLHILDSSAG